MPFVDVQAASRRDTEASLYSNNQETEQSSNDSNRLKVKHERRGSGSIFMHALNNLFVKNPPTVKPKLTRQRAALSSPLPSPRPSLEIPQTSFSLRIPPSNTPQNSVTPAFSQPVKPAFVDINLPIVIVSAETKEDEIRSSGTVLRVDTAKVENKQEKTRSRTESDPLFKNTLNIIEEAPRQRSNTAPSSSFVKRIFANGNKNRKERE